MNGVKSYFSHIGQFWQEENNGQIFRWNLLFIIIQVAILFFKFNDLPSQIPLFYSQPWGESQLASAIYIFIFPLISVFVLLVNSILAVTFLKTIPLLSRLLIIISLLISFFSAISLYHVIFLVT